jgi:putative heme iron utilization protein
MLNKTKKSLLIASLAASLGLGMMNVASAQPHDHVTVVVGWHGDRYWDGHRYWERREWERHHPPHHEPPPPPPHRY